MDTWKVYKVEPNLTKSILRRYNEMELMFSGSFSLLRAIQFVLNGESVITTSVW